MTVHFMLSCTKFPTFKFSDFLFKLLFHLYTYMYRSFRTILLVQLFSMCQDAYCETYIAMVRLKVHYDYKQWYSIPWKVFGKINIFLSEISGMIIHKIELIICMLASKSRMLVSVHSSFLIECLIWQWIPLYWSCYYSLVDESNS